MYSNQETKEDLIVSNFKVNFENIRSIVKNTFDFDLVFLQQSENQIRDLWKNEKFL